MNEITEIWDYLSEKIEKIYNGDQLTAVEKSTFISMVHKYCSTYPRHGHIPPQRRGEHLHANLLDFYKDHLWQYSDDLESISDDNELMFSYIECWTNYKKASELLNALCKHMNTYWLPLEMKSNKDVYTVYRTALIAFKNEIFDKINTPLINAVSYTIIAANQKGQPIKENLVFRVMESLIELYTNDRNERQTITVMKKMENVFSPHLRLFLQYYEENSKRELKLLLNDAKYVELEKRFPYLFLNLKDNFLDLTEIMKQNLWSHLNTIQEDRNIGKCLKFYTFFTKHCSQYKTEENWNRKYLLEFFEKHFNEQYNEMKSLFGNNEGILQKYCYFCNEYKEIFKKLDEWCDSINENNVKENNITYTVSKWCQKKFNEHNAINTLIADTIYICSMHSGFSQLVEETMQQLKNNGNSEIISILKSKVEHDILCGLKEIIFKSNSIVYFIKMISQFIRQREDFMWQVFPNTSDLWIHSLSIPSEDWLNEYLNEFLARIFERQKMQIESLQNDDDEILFKYRDYCYEFTTALLIVDDSYKSINENDYKTNHIMYKIYKWCLVKWNENASINLMIFATIQKYLTGDGGKPLVKCVVKKITKNGNEEILTQIKTIITENILYQLQEAILNVNNIVTFMENISKKIRHWENFLWEMFPKNPDLWINNLSIPSDNWKTENINQFLENRFRIQEQEIKSVETNIKEVLQKYNDFCNEFTKGLQIFEDCYQSKSATDIKDDHIIHKLYEWCLVKWNLLNTINTITADAIFKALDRNDLSDLVKDIMRKLTVNGNLEITTSLKPKIEMALLRQLNEMKSVTEISTYMENILMLFTQWRNLLLQKFPSNNDLWLDNLSIYSEDWNRKHLNEFLNQIFLRQENQLNAIKSKNEIFKKDEEILNEYVEYCSEYTKAKKIANSFPNNENKKTIICKLYEWCQKEWINYNSINELIAESIFNYFTDAGPNSLVDDVMNNLDENGNSKIKEHLHITIDNDLRCQLEEFHPNDKNIVTYMKSILVILINAEDLLWSVFPNTPELWITSLPMPSEDLNSKFLKTHFDDQKSELDQSNYTSEAKLKKYLDYCKEYEDGLMELSNHKYENRKIDAKTKKKIYKWFMEIWHKHNFINESIAEAMWKIISEDYDDSTVNAIMNELPKCDNSEIKRHLKKNIKKDLVSKLSNHQHNYNVMTSIKSIYNILDDNKRFLLQTFPNDSDMHITIEAFKSFIKSTKTDIENNGKNTKDIPESKARIIAIQCDQVLRNLTKYNENYFELTILILYYIDNYDFCNSYSNMQAFRLFDDSISIGNETVLYRLMEMCVIPEENDNRLTILKHLKKRIQEFDNFQDDYPFLCGLQNFSAITVEGQYWTPLKECPKIILPPEFLKPLKVFETFYTQYKPHTITQERHKIVINRKILYWHYFASQGELQYNINQKMYTLRANTYQMVVLLQYNHKTSYTVKNLMDNCGVDQDNLISVLQSLIDVDILTVENSTQLTKDSTIQLCTIYSNTQSRINISPAYQEPDPKPPPNLGYRIQALIMRIMKKKRQMSEHDLICEVKTVFSEKHEITVENIQKQIDKLINMYFVERNEEPADHIIYTYIP